MAVNLREKSAKELQHIDGIQLYVSQAGIKKENHDDLTLMVLAPSAQVAGVFTQNSFCAAPVRICRERLAKHNNLRAIVINTGNANAGNGQEGLDNARKVCEAVAQHVGCQVDQVLPFSTGVILEPLPVNKILTAIPKFRPTYWDTAAKAIMTTDIIPKATSRQITLDNQLVNVTGIAKGSGMICPNMATMLSFIATDAQVSGSLLQEWVEEVVDNSFNCITVDGDTSTNDSVILIATGKSKLPEITKHSENARKLKAAIQEVALELAQAIVRNGEGATKFITISVRSAKNIEEARKVAYSIANSPLVKTAFFASDANFGRIVCAIGNAGVHHLDINKVRVFIGNVLAVENGGRADLYEEADGQRIMAKSEVTVRIELQRGEAQANVYTCDLSPDYISINTTYRT